MSRSSDPWPAGFEEAFGRLDELASPIGRRVVFFESTSSTNDVALALAADPAAEGLVVIADHQTAGRGRRGRSWHSPAGGGLYVSVVLRPAAARADADRATRLLTLAAGVALADGIEQATALAADVKWPNDLLVGRRKLAGILAESVSGEPPHVVLGYGINVGARAFPGELDARATSLESELGRAIDRGAVCAATLVALATRYRDLLEGRFDAILHAWSDRAPSSRGARVAWNTPAGPRTGTTIGIDDQGALLVRVGGTTERIVGGEVTWL